MPMVYPRAEIWPLANDMESEERSRKHHEHLRSFGVRPSELGDAGDIARCSIAICIWLAGRDTYFLDESPFVELLLERDSRRELLEALEFGDSHDITEALLECLAEDGFDEVRFTRLLPAH